MRSERAMVESATAPGRLVPGVRVRGAARERLGSGRAYNTPCRVHSVRPRRSDVALRASTPSSPFAGRSPVYRGATADRCVSQPHNRAWRLAISYAPAGTLRSVRRSVSGEPISRARRLTIQWGPAMKIWIPDDSRIRRFPALAPGRSAVWCEYTPGRVDRLGESRARTRSMADLIFRVINITSIAGSRFVERRRTDSDRWTARLSTADWRGPARWRTVAE